MLVTQGVTEWNSLQRDQVLDKCKTLSDEQKKSVFKILVESWEFFKAATVALSLKDGSTIQHSSVVTNLCVQLSEGQRRNMSSPLIAEGFYNVAAEIAEIDGDLSFKDQTYREISIYGAEKSDIFLVRQFAESMHDVSKKDETLERAAKIIAEKGPRWIVSSDLKEIVGRISSKGEKDRVSSECKVLIGNRKV